jgi:uncharacterized membrane protein
MSDNPVQVIVAAFNSPDAAGQLMDELKQGKKAGLIGIKDAAVVVKNEKGKLKITDAKQRKAKGFVTGGVVGGVIGLIAAPPAAAIAAGGGLIGYLTGKLKGAALKSEMKELGSALTPNSSAIVAVIEHSWVSKLEAVMAEAGAQLIREVIKADIAEQLNAGGNVVYTAGDSALGSGAARVAAKAGEVQVSGIVMDGEGIFIEEAVITAEPAEESDAEETEALDAAQ